LSGDSPNHKASPFHNTLEKKWQKKKEKENKGEGKEKTYRIRVVRSQLLHGHLLTKRGRESDDTYYGGRQ